MPKITVNRHLICQTNRYKALITTEIIRLIEQVLEHSQIISKLQKQIENLERVRQNVITIVQHRASEE